ncbi:hypothetical protein EBB59_00565 [Lysobacter pythonis]|uniref:Transmembrane repetitive protein n=1 Tax=Solilutibacter pythonis TaxID=2483112 RepID=A0A3M2I412_9GAMM|nr:hypothetical protein EBB59_00565 [Lysobacter pythonis]
MLLARGRGRGSSGHPGLPGFGADGWDGFDSGWQLPAAAGPARDELVAVMAARPPQSPPAIPPELGRWQRWRGLFDAGWDPGGRTEPRLRNGAMVFSLFVNVLFGVFLLASMYLRSGGEAPPEEETIRIRITGFGSPETPGGGAAAADGEPRPAVAARQANAVTASARSARRPAPASARAVAAETQVVEQLLQVTETAEPVGAFRLPPMRTLAVPTPRAPELREAPAPVEQAIPGPLPDVRAIDLPAARDPVARAPAMNVREREIPMPEAPPPMRVPQLAAPSSEPRLVVRELPPRALPDLPAERADSGAASAAETAGNAPAAHATASPRPGLPGAAERSPRPGQAASGEEAGPARARASGGWSAPVRGDDWDAAARNRAGQASGGDRGNPRGAGGQGGGLSGPDGRPRLVDDRFKPRFPDPYKEGTWLKRPGLQARGTMFDSIWRPSETLLQEWVRKGVKSMRVPIPGTDLELECVVSMLQALGGCLPVAGKNGKFDQPARARPAPQVPFKRELFENQGDLTPPNKTEARPAEPGGSPA